MDLFDIVWDNDNARECATELSVRRPFAMRYGAPAWAQPTHESSLKIKRKKGIRWMPWHQKAMKDVALCDKFRGVESKL